MFLIFNLILFLIIALLLIVLSMVWPPDSPWAPWWRTNKKIAHAACELAGIDSKDLVYELGSGDAGFLIMAVKEFGARGFGIEIDPLRILISKLLIFCNRLSNKIVIKRGNIFNYDFKNASVIFVYLVPKTLNKLKPKFIRELKPGTKIISLRYEIDLPLVKYDKENNLRLYKIS